METYIDMTTPIPSEGNPEVSGVLDVPIEDVYSGPRLPTGIQSVDDRLYGGIGVGYTVIGGHEGGGKTSWALQILSRALVDDQGRRWTHGTQHEEAPYSRGVTIFSSEMPAKKLHRIMAQQLCYDVEIETSGSKRFPRYTVSEEGDRRIREEFGPWIKLLTPRLDGGAWTRFKATCEKLAGQGCKIFLFDNLLTMSEMVAMDLEHRGSSDNSLQAAVAAWVASFAAQHNCFVILICHTRKETSFDREATNLNDLISGSKAVANLATNVLFFTMLPKSDRLDDPDTTDRLVKLTKNRDFDKKLTQGVRTCFDSKKWTIREAGT